MIQHLLNFIGIGILSAILSIVAIIGNAMRIDRDPAVDGPRTLIAEFFGMWIAFAFLAWSFMLTGPQTLQWILRGIAAVAAIIGFSLAAYFAGTPEVHSRLDESPTGFENPITSLQLDRPALTFPDPPFVESTTGRRRRAWSELDVPS
jgi:hypothetical protein